MPFYVKNSQDEFKILEKETVISRKPSGKKIVVLHPVDDASGHMRAKALIPDSIIIKFGSGFKLAAMDEVVIKRGDFIVHDQQTNDMMVVIFSSQDIILDDTKKTINLK